MDGLIDTSVLIDIYRGHQPAINWYNENKSLVLGVSPIVWMELVEGAPDKVKQKQVTKLLTYFQIIYFTDADQKWAMRQLTRYNLSHNVDLTDALIASPAHHFNLPLYTRNIKHFLPIIPNLVTQPY